MRKFNLELHPKKRDFWSLVRMRSTNGSGWRRETGDVQLSWLHTHLCEEEEQRTFTVLRQTIRKRLQTKLNEVKAELQRRMHEPIPEVGKWLQAVVRGHIRYYGCP